LSFFNDAYRGTPPWDIGRPQKEFVRLEEKGEIVGDVLDIGCGTGENAMFLARKGHRVLGIDTAELAIKKAKQKSDDRRIKADFMVWDALRLGELKLKFDSAIDCGFFHTLSDEGRTAYEKNLASVLRPNGRYFMLAFSEEEPDWGGPRRVTRVEIRETFGRGWMVKSIQKADFEDLFHGTGGRAWLSAIFRA
jgi:cyclopropane fatty-acyl-phospholipid synthase-like methyltransferase